ncbi:hypothetical protein LJC34_03210 [Oscillospiraceae bacterium OttesenSCG-928-G22]|nr:hypothetical protein [Oscillospiraceae bacterium OttesenSCG-928-G22]
MSLVVLKFGGTSVNSEEKRDRVVDICRKQREMGNDLVVVLSAMGRMGEPYATDTLLSLLPMGADTPKNVSDFLAVVGETITVAVFTSALVAAGLPAFPMTGLQAGIKTDGVFGDSRVESVYTGKIFERLQAGEIVVITGFQGYSESMEVTTLGRGGSDTTALAVGSSVRANETVLYTDVAGVAQADPRILPEAQYLDSIDFDSLLFLSRMGAKVVHPNAAETAVRFQTPFYVRSLYGEGNGTFIGVEGEAPGGLYGLSILPEAKLYAAGGDEIFRASDGRKYSFRDVKGKGKPVKHFADCELLSACCDKTGRLTPDKLHEMLLARKADVRMFLKLDEKCVWVLPAGTAETVLNELYRDIE